MLCSLYNWNYIYRQKDGKVGVDLKEIFKLYKESIDIFRKNMSDFVGYKLLTSMILFAILLPAFRLIFNMLMKTRGLDYIANGLIKKFMFSPQGIIIVLLSIIIGFMTVLLDLGGTIVISHQRIVGSKDERFIDIIKYSLSKIKYLIGFDGLIIALYFVIIAPMLDSNLKVGIFESLKIPGFVMDVINSNDFYYTMLFLAAALVVFLTIRWMFAMHVLLLSDKVNKRFLKTSSGIIRNNYKKVFKYSILIGLIELFILLILFIVYIILSLIILVIAGESMIEMVLLCLFGLGIMLVILYGSFVLPLTIIRMTKLYHEFSDSEVKALEIEEVSSNRIGKKFLNNKSVFIVFLVVIVLGSASMGFMISESFNQTAYKVAITAHRGSSKDAPENTLSAIKKAIENGADYAEIDVQLTKDEKLILLHDSSFLRTTGVDKKPSEILYSDISKLDAGSWFSDDFVGEKIPSLKEVMDLSRGKLKLNIELKGSDVSPKLISKVIELIEKENFENECVITSLNYEDLVEVEKIKATLKTGYIMFVAIGQLENMLVDFYSVEESNVSENFISRAHMNGREVHVWTINKKEDMNSMLELGVDNIITDNDSMLRELMDKKINDASPFTLFE